MTPDINSVKPNKYVRFVRAVLAAVSKARVRLFRSKYSKRLYSQHVLLVLLALQQYENKSFRRFVEWLKASLIPGYLGLKCVPHFTTLHKALYRLPTRIVQGVVNTFVQLTRVRVLDLAIDSTGFTGTRLSHYYNKRLRKRKKWTKRYLKLTDTIETRTQLVCSHKVRKGPASDHKDFKPALSRITCKRVRIVVADKGYDAEKNHVFVHEHLKADCIIPPRNQNVPVWRTRGRYRKQMKKGYSKKKYNKRVLKETAYSVIKRLMSDGVRARLVSHQNKELGLRLIAYNAHRITKILFKLIGFLHGPSNQNNKY